jgi:hypothetical protein
MEQEIKSLTDAITQASSGNIVKDYILPVLVVLFAGAFAHYSAAFLRYRDAQKEKLRHANDWILGLQTAFNTLLTIKRNYHGIITGEPLNRVGKIPQIIMHKQPLCMKVSELSFIALSAEEFTGEYDNHRNLSYISSLQENYNVLLSVLNKRNALLAEHAEALEKEQANKGGNLGLNDMKCVLGEGNLAALVDITEALIHFTDDLVIAIHNFLCEFPDICRITIDIQRIKHTGKIIEHFYDRDELLKHSPAMNTASVSNILSRPIQEIKSKYVIFGKDKKLKPIIKNSSQINDKSNISKNIERFEFKKKVQENHRWKWI